MLEMSIIRPRIRITLNTDVQLRWFAVINVINENGGESQICTKSYNHMPDALLDAKEQILNAWSGV